LRKVFQKESKCELVNSFHVKSRRRHMSENDIVRIVVHFIVLSTFF